MKSQVRKSSLMNGLLRLSVASLAILVSFQFHCAGGETPEKPLFEFGPAFDMAQVHTADAQANLVSTEGARALRIRTGHSQTWPGVTLTAPGGKWDLSTFSHVSLRVRNHGPKSITVNLRVDNPGADGTRNCVNGSTSIEPGASATLRADLKRSNGDKLGGKLFGLRGYPVKAGGEGAVDPANITQFLVFVSQPKEDQEFEILEARAAGVYTSPTAWTSDADPFFPLIDPLGQYNHKNWPGKTKSAADLTLNREQEAKALASHAGPSGWDQYGGWATGPKLEATGFFRVQKQDGKWWLVDPEGRLFWSHGVDCVRMLDATPFAEREDWFAEAPWKQAEFAEFIIPSAYALHGHYAGKSPQCFSFAGTNLKRKYGADWKTAYPPVIHQRLRAWGLNTIANWSDMGVARMRRTPYTDTVGSHGAKMIEGSEGYWGKFPDVFDPDFRDRLRQQMARKKGGTAGDPWCLGYFSDNEMSWGDEVSLALAALRSPATQPAKQAFLADIKAKYADVAKLNASWGTVHASWDALANSTARPDTSKAGEDLRAFYTRTAEHYFRTVRDAIKEVAPNHLYLGCRFAWANARAAAAAGKYCDVVSYNLYQRNVSDFKPTGAGDVPLLIGEFHFGALDRGMFHTGLVPVNNQAARAQAYRDYVEGTLRHPQFVGTHWFQYQDEPTTGRVYDEENYQIGLVDIADTPYAETVTAVREVGERMYRVRSGR